MTSTVNSKTTKKKATKATKKPSTNGKTTKASTTKKKATTRSKATSANGKANRTANNLKAATEPLMRSDRLALEVPLDRCHPDPRNRKVTTADITERAESIKEEGLLQPILVRPDADLPDGHYRIVFGETRWLACKKLKRPTIDAEIKEMTAAEALKKMTAENAERKDLNDIQKAEKIVMLCKPETEGGAGMTRADAAGLVGLGSGGAASNLVRLLELPKPIQTLIAAGEIPQTHARELLKVDAEFWKLKAVDKKSKGSAGKSAIEFFKEVVADFQTHGTPPRDEFVNEAINDSLFQDIDRATFKPTEAQRKELKIIKVPNWRGELEEVATNLKLFWELENAAREKREGRNASNRGKASKKDETADGKPLTAAEKKAIENERRKRYKAQVDKWIQRFKRYSLAFEFTDWDDPRVVRLVCWASNWYSGGKFCALFKRVLKELRMKIPSGNQWEGSWLYKLLAVGTNAKDPNHCVLACVASELFWPEDIETNWEEIPPAIVNSLGKEYKINAAQMWATLVEDRDDQPSRKLLESFFKIHSADQLDEILKDNGVTLASGGTKGARVNKLMAMEKIKLPKIVKF